MEIKAGVIVLILAALSIYFFIKSKKQTQNFAYIDEYAFHSGVVKRFTQTRPELSPEEVSTVVLALKDYFKIHNRAAGKFLSMPSQVVDVLWHEFILFTKEYDTFCKGAIGHYLHHVPSEAMQDKKVASDGIKNTWVYACELEEINPKNPTKLPRLFLLDKKFNIKNGFYYTRDCSSSTGAAYCASHIDGSGSSGCGSSSDAQDSSNHSCGSGCGGD
jgi:hypothetical protein